MRLLFIGDVMGRPGRQCLRTILLPLVEQLGIDIVVANGENIAGGRGITAATLIELEEAGVHIITSGNHVWDNKEAMQIMDKFPYLLRPANYPRRTTPGKGVLVYEQNGYKLGVLNLSGRVFMQPLDCPFQRAEEEVNALRQQGIKMIILDFHAEATSEKQAMGWYMDGKISAVIGTHSHVQTADERLLPGGTAYITDAGMTGAYDSILGMDRHKALNRFITQLPTAMTVGSGKTQFNGVLIDIDPETGRARHIRRIYEVI